MQSNARLDDDITIEETWSEETGSSWDSDHFLSEDDQVNQTHEFIEPPTPPKKYLHWDPDESTEEIEEEPSPKPSPLKRRNATMQLYMTADAQESLRLLHLGRLDDMSKSMITMVNMKQSYQLFLKCRDLWFRSASHWPNSIASEVGDIFQSWKSGGLFGVEL